MHEAQQTKEQTPVAPETQAAKRPRNARPYKFFVAVKHRQVDLEHGKPCEPEFLEFPDKAAMREGLAQPKFDGAELRIIRGYEMTVKARRSISVN
jgi:hypothetical protein